MEIFLIIVIIAASFGISHAVGYYRAFGRWDARMKQIEIRQKESHIILGDLEEEMNQIIK